MSKVDWITWKTNKEEIINPDKIMEDMNNQIQEYNDYMNQNVYERISQEIQMGGLDNVSLNLMGASPANESAIHIMNHIDEIKSIIDNIKTDVYNTTEEQKQIEKEQLQEAIKDKIAEEEQILKNTVQLKERLTTENTFITIQEVDDIIASTNTKIQKLKERLEIASSI